MLKQLKFRNREIPGYFIDENAKIYNTAGVEQKQYLCSSRPYYYFKAKPVHLLMCHSFFCYKEGYEVHHLNQVKTDNHLSNLKYLTRFEHRSLHATGKKYCLGKKLSAEHKEKLRKSCQKSSHKKPVYCLELDRVFESIKQASRELKLSDNSIWRCCKGKYKTTGGYHFKYHFN